MKARIIIADCPWKFGNRRLTRKDNPTKKTRFGMGVTHRYEHGVMSTKELCELAPYIQAIAAPDAYCFLWGCNSMSKDTQAVMEAWGFKPILPGCFTWAKRTKHGKWAAGGGHYTQTNTELVALGRRGRMWHTNTGMYVPNQLVEARRPVDAQGQEIHSAKPEDVQDRIERWLGPQLSSAHCCVELFARRVRPFWVCLGGSLSGRDIRCDLTGLAATMRAHELLQAIFPQ